ncbi:hypothetical protein SAY87_008825 [Trapa incisa]|uniref:Myb-like domain-containing protein n=1 Tax=Trapa incisa TaxID=236973 RepID=A0AAN7JUX1_9MYRT|nr:hypothetical protein SAY87_008825 [Trapa incisa]
MATTDSSPPRSPAVLPPETDPDPSPNSPVPEVQSEPPPPPSAPASVNPRRPPPPCWSPDETVALIDTYSEKWQSLGRAALKLNHWQEVADAVASRCPISSPSKTAIQCRHKMEKLRKRYRAEIRRAQSLHRARSASSWVHFQRMEAMDRSRSVSEDEDDEDEDLDGDLYNPRKRKEVRGANAQIGISRHFDYPNGASKNKEGFRIKIPNKGQQKSKLTKPNGAYSAEIGHKRGQPPEEWQRGVSDPLQEVVNAVKFFREGFERMEKMKMEMAQEMGAMQREMEMKRTEMILGSQQFIVETLAKVISEKRKKKKRKTSSSSICDKSVGGTPERTSSKPEGKA